jgi:4-hydroxybenzoate polyprenyltransferase
MTALCAGLAAWRVDFFWPVSVILLILLLVAVLVAWRFVSHPVTTRAKSIEQLSGIWTILMYLSVGALPLLWRWWPSAGEVRP